MIPWHKYDPQNPPEPGRYFISDGIDADVAIYTKLWDGWSISDDSLINSSNDVTHYAVINLPGEEEA